uniref:Tubulin-specific chaperone D n=1 Tax=Bursaphelenchus xylophilus TaxID=6326 RepID=A0A1I7SGS8_BURXY
MREEVVPGNGSFFIAKFFLTIKTKKLGCNIYAQLYTRNASNSKALSHFTDGLTDVKMNSKTAIYNLQILHNIFKLGKREELMGFTDPVLNYCYLCYSNSEKNAVVVVHCIKLFQRACMIYLSPRLANWRYQRQNKRIECCLDTQQVEDFGRSLGEGVDPIEQDHGFKVEGILQSLQKCLDSDSNDVRWASAKGMARILARLPENHTQRVVDELMTRLRKDKSTCFWNGACLLLAELTTRGCILPKTIPLLLGIVREAMLFDFGGFMNTTETNVRDSACYICWSIARAYPKEIFQSSLEPLSNLLICTALFDRDVNIRRAASASFQEHVGRHVGFSHGIQVLVAIDFAAIAMIKRCFSDICVNVARFHEYLKPMLDFLCHHKTINWDGKVREMTGYALQRLSPLDIQYSKETLFPYLIEALTATHDIIHKHGLLFACSAIISVVSDELNTDDESVIKIVTFVSDSLDTMRSRKLEHVPLLIRGICRVMKSLLNTGLVTCKVTVMKWISTVECVLENVRIAEVKGLQIATKDLLVDVLQSVFDFWNRTGDKEAIRNHLSSNIVQVEMSSRI